MAATTSGFDTAAVTLAQYAKLANDSVVDRIVFSLHEKGNALKDIPLHTNASLRKRGARWVDNLPGVNYTPLNAPPVVVSGSPTQWQEQVYIVANRFQTDTFINMDNNAIGGRKPLDSEYEAWQKAFKFDFNNKFINNDHTGATGSDPNAWVGLKGRLNAPTQYGVNSEMSYNCGTVMTGALTSANAEATLYTLQLALDYMDNPTGENSVLYCSDVYKRRLEQSVRTVGAGAGFDITRDSYDRPVEVYKDLKIMDLGRQGPVAPIPVTATNNNPQTTRIVSTTENADGSDTGTGTYTSFYIVHYGDDSFCGWQMNPFKMKNLGEDPITGAAINYVIRWAMGLWQEDTRAVFRGYNNQLA